MSKLSFYDQQHLARMFVQEQRVNRLFNALIDMVSPDLKKWKDSGRNNVWLRNSSIENNIDRRLLEFQSLLEAEIKTGSLDAWKLSDKKNDKLVEDFIKGMALKNISTEGMFARNLDAFETFQKRVDDGMTLSNRVVSTVQGTKKQMEHYLKSGIGTGRSADVISRDIRQLLDEPDKRFHRIRDLKGNLIASQPMKDYHPGQGVYRSSKMNAKRIAVTETNMAYRLSDCERWKKMDFILGFEVKRSGNGKPCIVCDAMIGKYPKDFVFSGWHSFCICFAVPIVMDHSDFADFLLHDVVPNEKVIKTIPSDASKFIADKEDLVKKSYWGKQNFASGNPFTEKVVSLVLSIPTELMKNGEYLKGTSIVFKDEFFNLINQEDKILLRINKKGGSFYLPGNKSVNIENGARAAKSEWERESVVYHEFGHAIDWQKNLRTGDPVKSLMDKYRKILSTKKERTLTIKQFDYAEMKYVPKTVTMKMSEYAYVDERLKQLYSKIFRVKPEVFTKLGITKHDVIEQIGSTMDTIMSLNPNYGAGHTKAYFKRAGTKEAEFIAHAFENTFATNVVFKKYLPDLYEEMIQYIKALK